MQNTEPTYSLLQEHSPWLLALYLLVPAFDVRLPACITGLVPSTFPVPLSVLSGIKISRDRLTTCDSYGMSLLHIVQMEETSH